MWAITIRAGTDVGPYSVVRMLRPLRGQSDQYLCEARDERTRDMVAVRLVRGRVALDEGGTLLEPLAEALKAVNHPHVIPILDQGYVDIPSNGLFAYQAMSPMSGEVLAAALEVGEQYKPVEALRIAHDIAAGLEALHSAGIAHGDVCPENIVLERGNRGRLMATGMYGIVNPVDGPNPPDPRPYDAPERINHAPTPLADLYSLGLVLYELLTGRQAAATVAGYVPGQRDSLSAKPPAPFSSTAPHLPRPLEALTFTLLQVDPKNRVQSAAEFRGRLRQLVASSQKRKGPVKK